MLQHGNCCSPWMLRARAKCYNDSTPNLLSCSWSVSMRLWVCFLSLISHVYFVFSLSLIMYYYISNGFSLSFNHLAFYSIKELSRTFTCILILILILMLSHRLIIYMKYFAVSINGICIALYKFAITTAIIQSVIHCDGFTFDKICQVYYSAGKREKR